MKNLLVALGTAVLTVVVHNMKVQQQAEQQRAAAAAPAVQIPAPAPVNAPAPAPAAAPAPQKMPASVVHATKVIDNYLKRHPKGRGAAPLRRISVAIKQRPMETKPIAEAAARTVSHQPLTKKDEAMLEEAATLAERTGLSPKEMADFMKKWERSAHAVVAEPEEKANPMELPSFDGQLHLIYRFEGFVQCGQPSCTNIPVSVRASAGHWVESREDVTDKNGHYVLELPVISQNQEKVLWHLETHTKDLRHVELSGEHPTTRSDHDVTLQNNLVIP